MAMRPPPIRRENLTAGMAVFAQFREALRADGVGFDLGTRDQPGLR